MKGHAGHRTYVFFMDRKPVAVFDLLQQVLCICLMRALASQLLGILWPLEQPLAGCTGASTAPDPQGTCAQWEVGTGTYTTVAFGAHSPTPT